MTIQLIKSMVRLSISASTWILKYPIIIITISSIQYVKQKQSENSDKKTENKGQMDDV